jgi:hypothetical protein
MRALTSSRIANGEIKLDRTRNGSIFCDNISCPEFRTEPNAPPPPSWRGAQNKRVGTLARESTIAEPSLEPMNAADSKRICVATLARGGSLTDTDPSAPRSAAVCNIQALFVTPG